MFRILKAATKTKGAEWPFILNRRYDTKPSHSMSLGQTPILKRHICCYSLFFFKKTHTKPAGFPFKNNSCNCQPKEMVFSTLFQKKKQHSQAPFALCPLTLPRLFSPHRGGCGADLHRNEEGREGRAVAVGHRVDHAGHLHVVPVDGALDLHAAGGPGLLQGRPPGRWGLWICQQGFGKCWNIYWPVVILVTQMGVSENVGLIFPNK